VTQQSRSGADYVMVLDVGSSGVRGVLYSRDLEVVERTYIKCPPNYPRPAWVEYDLHKVWETVKTALRRCLKESGLKSSAVAGLAITTQRNVLVVWDKATGEPAENAIGWQDARSEGILRQCLDRGFDRSLEESSGQTLSATNLGLRLKWLLDNKPEIAKGLADGSLLVGTLDTWLVFRLSQRNLFVTDHSSAATTGLYNIFEQHWDTRIVRTLGLEVAPFPEVVASSSILDNADSSLLGEETLLAGLCVDQQSALFGHRCLEPGEAKCTLGSGAFFLVNLGNSPQLVLPELKTRIAWSDGETATYALEGFILHTGTLMEWLLSLGLAETMEEATMLASRVESSEGVFLVPALSGLASPYWDPGARGIVSGLRVGITRGHIWRAALEAVALQIWEILDVVERRTDIRIRHLQVDGGVAANDALMAIVADITDVPVRRSPFQERTALGVAGLAGLAMGWWNDPHRIPLSHEEDTVVFKPQMDTLARERLCQGWKRAVAQTLSKNSHTNERELERRL